LENDMPAQIRKRLKTKQGFTLIELIVVILIILILVVLLLVAIFAIFSNTKKGRTKTAMQSVGDGWTKLVSDDQWFILANPRDEKHRFTNEFITAANINAAGGVNDMTHEQRSMLLALILLPTREQWEKGMNKVGGSLPSYDPPIAEENTRSFRQRGASGWDFVIDGWAGPVSYTIDVKSAASGGAPELKLMSPGEDGKFETENDNWYWTKSRGVHQLD